MNLPDRDGRRPTAGSPDHCLYCALPYPEHRDDCVCRVRTVVMELRIRYVTEIPLAWDEDMITFSRNESSRCASNDVQQIAKELGLFDEDEDETRPCACSRSESVYLREATEEDHQALAYRDRE